MSRLAAFVVTSALLLGTAACGGEDDEPARREPPSVAELDDQLGSDRPEKQEPLPSAPPLTEEFVPPESAPELGARLGRAEDLARDPATEEAVRAAAAFETQLLYRQLARTPQWERRARAAVPPRYRADLDAHLTARRSLRSVLTTLSAELPAWEIVEPAPTADLRRFYREGERVHGVAWELLAAINLVETGFGKIRGLSSAGAQGPMQFIPSTWAAYGEGDVTDPHDAILGAANYLAANGGGTGTTTGPGVENALYRYNNHPGYVDGILAYASVLERDPRALHGLVRWQIVYLSTIGDLWLPVGYRETAPVPVRAYVRQHPERHLGTDTR
ncbi:lytic transglycosylase [Nocardioides silvaticus]|uniref:Lytic transglycosylase n=1 Tax=Nocardioides silvaticus TaxID=2201891 RepID=A0A316TK16_9ACTN|nr:lytic transglycosylase domain-containing protein [Nocardioides silvaticus]PWN04098.1 lytic transglycosylase [Nocardioides silvaticus]